MQKTVIINRGIPASGKSTIAKEIVITFKNKNLSATIHSTDDYFMVDDKYCFDETKLRENHLKNQATFRESLQKDIELVICDNTNIEPWEALPYYEMAKEYDYRVILIDFASRDIQEHLALQEQDPHYQHNIPKDIILDMDNRYQNYKELTSKHSYPNSSLHPKREYDEKKGKIVQLDESSHPFYYDNLIKIDSEDFSKFKEIAGEMIFRKIRDYDLDSIKLIPQHYQLIMKEFQKRPNKTLTASDLEHILTKSEKQIQRDIKTLQSEFKNIIDVKVGRRNGYKLIDAFDIFIEAFKNQSDLYELFELAKKSDVRLLKKLESTIMSSASVYYFNNPIFEFIENEETFNHLKQAIRNHEYRKITFADNDTSEEVKCLKLVFVDNNWYVAYVDSKNILKLGRVTFIQKVSYAIKNSYQKSSIEPYLIQLDSKIQNSLTLFDREPKRARLQATPNIAKYFQKNMKKFFKTQEFKESHSDGSVIFTVLYTQELEILPFIQKWMPDLIILEPQELRDLYIQKIERSLQYYKESK